MRFLEYAFPPKATVHAHDERNEKDFKKQMPLHNRALRFFPGIRTLPGEAFPPRPPLASLHRYAETVKGSLAKLGWFDRPNSRPASAPVSKHRLPNEVHGGLPSAHGREIAPIGTVPAKGKAIASVQRGGEPPSAGKSAGQESESAGCGGATHECRKTRSLGVFMPPQACSSNLQWRVSHGRFFRR
jgi:hypothetical protein